MNTEQKVQSRSEEITERYLKFIALHVENVANGSTDDFMEINEIGRALHISHSHLIDLVKTETGRHPCYYYEREILKKAKELLTNTDLSIAAIAQKLTYDPSNFNKYFKRYTGLTPGQYRKGKKETIP